MAAAADLVKTTQPRRPRIAVTLGDPSGIGPELAAKLLSNPSNRESRHRGVHVVATSGRAGPQEIQILDDHTSTEYQTQRGEVSKDSGARCIYRLKRALKLAQAGEIDGIVFAPLNKSSLKLAGMKEEDELRWFANQLNFKGTTSEINIAGSLWIGRVTSYIGVEELARRITKESTMRAIELLHRLRWESGVDAPRLGVCALNPHNGENGAFGRQEIDAIRPAVEASRANGIDVQGPFPCDTIFLKRQHFDGIVTMYHDQGQIAMKLLSFDGGVTVQGGLPLPIATPAHGTAFDIAGRNLAAVTSTQNAFDLAVTMADRRIQKQAQGEVERAVPLKRAALPQVNVVELHATCC
ncbi:hypothetical protein PMIN02_005844 [Paraphaeosphaeria minitans]|uniref:4-hydroxythreonine-4-phosphate dehydrogenase n=1 Tax=Paraphaeosphaeria minitans TaxID=565426 RepID=A0A9P6KVU7_9PLEO|nr:hypothetical protein PMIN01_02879 [Paraphaeosphaeria minitans]